MWHRFFSIAVLLSCLNSIQAQKNENKLSISGADTICPFTTYRFTATKASGKQLFWKCDNCRIAEYNPSDSITVWFDPSKKDFSLSVSYKTEENLKPTDSIFKRLHLPNSKFHISTTQLPSEIVSGSYTTFRAETSNALLYDWKLSPPTAGSIVSNGSQEVVILWHEVPKKQIVSVIVSALICGTRVSSRKELELLPATGKPVKQAKVKSKPDASFTFNDNACKDMSVKFKPVDFKSGDSYKWEFGGVFNTNPEPVYCFDREGLQPVTLTVTDENGNSTTESKFITIIDNKLEGMLFKEISENQSQATLEFSASPFSASPSSFTWMHGNRVLATTTTNKFTVRESGEYWLKVVSSQGCEQNILPPVQVIIPKKNFKKRPD